MIDFSKFLSRGDGVWWGQAAAEPRPLVEALILQSPRIGPIRTFTGLSWNDQLAITMPDRMSMVSYGGLGELRELSRSGRLDVVPCHYSALPRMFAERRLPCDVGLLQVSPPDKNGTCSLGIGVDYVADAMRHTPVLVAEINQRMPATVGTQRIPIDRFAATINTDRALAEDPTRAPGATEQRIAAHVAGLVDDGDTVQFGVGSLGAAVLDALAEHQDLGFHTGMVTDGLLRLVDKGVATGSRKEIDPGLIVAGTALGSAELYNRVPDLPARFLPTSYTHSPQVLSQLQLAGIGELRRRGRPQRAGGRRGQPRRICRRCRRPGGLHPGRRAHRKTIDHRVAGHIGWSVHDQAVARRRSGHHRALRRRHRRHRIRRRASARLQS